jgi:hypothetical protein
MEVFLVLAMKRLIAGRLYCYPPKQMSQERLMEVYAPTVIFVQPGIAKVQRQIFFVCLAG